MVVPILHLSLVADGAQEGARPGGSNTSRPCIESDSKIAGLQLIFVCRLLYPKDLPILYSKTKNQALVSITKMHRESLAAMQLVESGSSF
jgi:hypothetical protein